MTKKKHNKNHFVSNQKVPASTNTTPIDHDVFKQNFDVSASLEGLFIKVSTTPTQSNYGPTLPEDLIDEIMDNYSLSHSHSFSSERKMYRNIFAKEVYSHLMTINIDQDISHGTSFLRKEPKGSPKISIIKARLHLLNLTKIRMKKVIKEIPDDGDDFASDFKKLVTAEVVECFIREQSNGAPETQQTAAFRSKANQLRVGIKPVAIQKQISHQLKENQLPNKPPAESKTVIKSNSSYCSLTNYILIGGTTALFFGFILYMIGGEEQRS